MTSLVLAVFCATATVATPAAAGASDERGSLNDWKGRWTKMLKGMSRVKPEKDLAYPISTIDSETPLFSRPQQRRFASYSVLCGYDDRERATRAEDDLDEIDRRLVQRGAKSYLSGATRYNADRWKEHWPTWGKVTEYKRRFDPDGIRPGQE